MSNATIERPGVAGRVMAAGERIPLCTGDGGCFPPADELSRMAMQARQGRPQPFVGLGRDDQRLFCPHGEWRLGDLLVPLSRPCQLQAHDDCRDAGCQCSHHLAAYRPAGVPETGLPGVAEALAAAVERNRSLEQRLAAVESRAVESGICTGTKVGGQPCGANVIRGTDRCVAHPRGN